MQAITIKKPRSLTFRISIVTIITGLALVGVAVWAELQYGTVMPRDHISAPTVKHEISTKWLPELQEAAHRFSDDTAYRVKIRVHSIDGNNLEEQIQDNIGPKRGWYVRTHGNRYAKTQQITMPAHDVPLLYELQSNPGVFVNQYSGVNVLDDPSGRMVNVLLKYTHSPETTNEWDVLSTVCTLVGGLTAGVGIIVLLAMMNRRNDK